MDRLLEARISLFLEALGREGGREGRGREGGREGERREGRREGGKKGGRERKYEGGREIFSTGNSRESHFSDGHTCTHWLHIM